MDLQTLTLPPDLTPTLHDLMTVAERTFARGTGADKKWWVRESMRLMLASQAIEAPDRAPAWREHPMAPSLFDVLIEAVWAIHFRVEPTPIARAMAGLSARKPRLV